MAMVVGLVFLAIGILGFVPGITTDFDQLKFAGHNSDAQLLDVFQTSILHNMLQLALGIAGVALARTWRVARTYLVAGGLINIALFVYGAIVTGEGAANFIPVNWGDNVLHLVLGAAMILIAFVVTPEPTPAPQATP